MSMLHTMLITADPGLGGLAVRAGVDQLFVDLESMGKAARQGHLDTWKSPHGPQDVSALRAALPDASILVRLNPMHDGTRAEVEDALARGADALMLPMFHDAAPVLRFAEMVAGRAQVAPLAETRGAVETVADWLPAVDRLHIGLNDLALDCGMGFLFQPLAEGMLEAPAEAIRASGVPFGIGGIARLGGGAVPAEVVLGELARLGATWVILSRAFHGRATGLDDLPADFDFKAELGRLSTCYDEWTRARLEALAANREDLRRRVAGVLEDE